VGPGNKIYFVLIFAILYRFLQWGMLIANFDARKDKLSTIDGRILPPFMQDSIEIITHRNLCARKTEVNRLDEENRGQVSENVLPPSSPCAKVFNTGSEVESVYVKRKT